MTKLTVNVCTVRLTYPEAGFMAHVWHSACTQMSSLWKSWTEIWQLCILERGKFSSVKLWISEKVKTVQWSVDTKDNQLSTCWYRLIQIQKCFLNWWKSSQLSHCVILVGQGSEDKHCCDLSHAHPSLQTHGPTMERAVSQPGNCKSVSPIMLPLVQEFSNLSVTWIS